MDQEPSLWIAQADEILNLKRNRLSVREIVEHSVRLDCILPCIDKPNMTDGPAVKGFALGDGLLSYQDCLDVILGNDVLRNQFEGAMRIAV